MKRVLRLAGNLCFLALLLLIVLTATDYLKQQVLGVQTSDVSLKLWIGGVFLCAAGLVCLGARRKWPPEICFLLAFVPMALVFWACVPLFQVPDEGLHAVRAFALSDGQVYKRIVQLPSGFRYDTPVPLTAEGWRALIQDTRLDWAQTQPWDIATTVFYSPLNYLPQALGIRVARLFTDRLYLLGAAGRLFCLAAVCAILFQCVRRLPVGKNLLIAASLTPMFLQEAVSLSADGLVFAVLAADVTLFVCLLKRKAPMTRRERALLILLCALTLSVKPLYFVFILPFAFLPADRFGGSRRRTLLIAYGCSVVLALVWLGPMLLGQDMTTAKRLGVDVSLHRQLLGILADPLEYLRCLIRTLVEKGEFYINSSMSSFLYLTVGLPDVFTFAQYALLGYTCSRDGALGEYPRARRVLLACSLLSALVIFTGEYLQWTQVGFPVVEGVQGRYFVPLLFPVLLSMTHREAAPQAPFSWRAAATQIAMLTLCALSILNYVTC